MIRRAKKYTLWEGCVGGATNILRRVACLGGGDEYRIDKTRVVVGLMGGGASAGENRFVENLCMAGRQCARPRALSHPHWSVFQGTHDPHRNLSREIRQESP